ncbi:MAG: hypothetical protein Q9160_004417 [Pyrenula sp. 1 TL-2023]
MHGDRITSPNSLRCIESGSYNIGHVRQSLTRSISPPLTSRKSQTVGLDQREDAIPTTSAVEAGASPIGDSLTFFSTKLFSFSRPVACVPRIPYEEWIILYKRNQHQHGRHFCNEMSSVSWAVAYGLPGDPNSIRLNRGAVETRVHSLWVSSITTPYGSRHGKSLQTLILKNHLIETASHSTGSMLIWDTGEYTVLPYHESSTYAAEDSSSNEHDNEEEAYTLPKYWTRLTDSEKLGLAFSQGKIRLRLHGTRLPHGYTIGMRLSKEDKHKAETSRLQKPRSKRRRLDPQLRKVRQRTISSTDSENEEPSALHTQSSRSRTAPPPKTDALASSGDESETIRAANAYPGAKNDIGSVHQRRWYLSLDRDKSGFRRQRGKVWTRKSEDEGFEAFHVMGREVERSVVTGRLGQDILDDEGVEGYVPRARWRPVME